VKNFTVLRCQQLRRTRELRFFTRRRRIGRPSPKNAVATTAGPWLRREDVDGKQSDRPASAPSYWILVTSVNHRRPSAAGRQEQRCRPAAGCVARHHVGPSPSAGSLPPIYTNRPSMPTPATNRVRRLGSLPTRPATPGFRGRLCPCRPPHLLHDAASVAYGEEEGEEGGVRDGRAVVTAMSELVNHMEVAAAGKGLGQH
jgi:hypothetical protein